MFASISRDLIDFFDLHIGQQSTTQLKIDTATDMIKDNAQNAADDVRAFA
jgi:hypothetical protein